MSVDWNNVKRVEPSESKDFPSWVTNSSKPNYYPEHSAERDGLTPYNYPRAKGHEQSPFYFAIAEGPPVNKGGSRKRRHNSSRRIRRNKSGRRIRRNKSGRRIHRNKSGRRRVRRRR